MTRPQATTYTVRRLGETAWMSGIPTLSAAQREAQRANRICAPGHIVVATTPTGEAAVPPGTSAEGETR